MIIGLVGYSGCGKSEIATELERRGWMELSPSIITSDDCVAMLSGIETDMSYGQLALDIRDNKELYRPLLEWYGAWRRIKDPSYFTDHLYNTMKSHATDFFPKKNYVISNVRYPNEVAMIHEAGGLVVGVLRDGHGPKHIGEMYIPFLDIDIHVENDGPIPEVVNHMLATLKGGLPHGFPVGGPKRA